MTSMLSAVQAIRCGGQPGTYLGASRRALLQAGLASLGWAADMGRAQALAVDAPQEAPPSFLLAQCWQPGQSPNDYLVSEKFDGVRAYWDGTRLRLRGGGQVAAPAWFTAGLPYRQPLDGELWMGYGRFDEVSGAVRRQQAQDEAWRHIRYQVFELPEAVGSFAARYERLCSLKARPELCSLQVVEQRRVADAAALDRWLMDVVAAGGEGLVLHRADAPYLTGRQQVLAKYKPVQDGEAIVLAHLPGKGRLSGRVGALWVRNEQGQEFSIGTGLTDAQRDQPPPVGSRITYAWRGLTSAGLPRFASFVRDRPAGV
jgi:DNA ligase-1